MKIKEITEGDVLTYTNVNDFIKKPWDWLKMRRDGILDTYTTQKLEQDPEQKGGVSLFTAINLQDPTWKKDGLIKLDTPNNEYLSQVKDSRSWYDQKIQQIYDSFKIKGKKPEDYLL